MNNNIYGIDFGTCNFKVFCKPTGKILSEKNTIAIINKNLSNSDLTVDDIAQEVGLSRVHLYRKMKELTNQSPHQFIRNIRVRQAARLLKSGRYKVSEIMYACGFPNATAFNNGFKAVYGISPREYMKKM